VRTTLDPYTREEPMSRTVIGADRVEYNMDLSDRRAQRVANGLVFRGVKRVRVATIAIGPHQPIASNETAEGRALNRRVELTLFPLTAG
jgi:outer membrane protein OmpA-like peptidoglycan-associated protein